MGEKGTHPWSQGYPLTSQIPGGPEMPKSISIVSTDLKYPKAWGQPNFVKQLLNIITIIIIHL